VCRFLCEDTNLKPKTKPGRRAQTQTRAHKPPTASFWSGKIPPWRLFCRSDNNKGAFAAGFIIVFVAPVLSTGQKEDENGGEPWGVGGGASFF